MFCPWQNLHMLNPPPAAETCLRLIFPVNKIIQHISQLFLKGLSIPVPIRQHKIFVTDCQYFPFLRDSGGTFFYQSIKDNSQFQYFQRYYLYSNDFDLYSGIDIWLFDNKISYWHLNYFQLILRLPEWIFFLKPLHLNCSTSLLLLSEYG